MFMCIRWMAVAFASHCFSLLCWIIMVTKMANSKQKASSMKEVLVKPVSRHIPLMTVIILISSQLFSSCGWLEQSSALSAAYLICVSMKRRAVLPE